MGNKNEDGCEMKLFRGFLPPVPDWMQDVRKKKPSPETSPAVECFIGTFWITFEGLFASLQDRIHKNAVNKGFWKTKREKAVSLCLIHAEVSEALEAIRDGNPKDKHLPHRDSFEVELADIVIRVMDLAGHNNIPLANVIMEKVAFNETRPKKHGKKF